MKAEYEYEFGFLQKTCSERNGSGGVQRAFNPIWKEKDSAQAGLLEKILDIANLNRAFQRVEANKGSPGVDDMSVSEAFQYIRVHRKELIARIYKGNYTPAPVKRVEIPKPNGGTRNLGVPIVVDRTIQQAICQQLMPIYEPIFSKPVMDTVRGEAHRIPYERLRNMPTADTRMWWIWTWRSILTPLIMNCAWAYLDGM